MESSETNKLTQKALLTRQHIMETAWLLFATIGYDQTTMRDIAAGASCSQGIFSYRKEEHSHGKATVYVQNSAAQSDAHQLRRV